MHSGLTSDLRDCGTRSNWYTYVFVGSISAMTPIANGEKRLQLAPEEVFLGEPRTPLTVVTSQAPCLPELAVGDRWLFFLRQENGKPITLDYYGNDSRPVAGAQKQIETLRRLAQIGDRGILSGELLRDTLKAKPVAQARVVAERTSDKAQYFTMTDAQGHYEFQPLPKGEYKVSADPIGSFQPDDASIELKRGECWDLILRKYPHGELAGYVRRSDGSPVEDVGVLLIPVDGLFWTTTQTDSGGHFSFDSLGAGKYVVAINLPGAPAWKFSSAGGVAPPPASLYYPGMRNRADAIVIPLDTDEKREDINFVIPLQ